MLWGIIWQIEIFLWTTKWGTFHKILEYVLRSASWKVWRYWLAVEGWEWAKNLIHFRICDDSKRWYSQTDLKNFQLVITSSRTHWIILAEKIHQPSLNYTYYNGQRPVTFIYLWMDGEKVYSTLVERPSAKLTKVIKIENYKPMA